jgi:hypothetical protein
MKQRPIIMTAESVRAIEGDCKTQTRRVIMPQPTGGFLGFIRERKTHWFRGETRTLEVKCPYGQPGDRLWVRETWACVKWFDHFKPSEIPKGDERWPSVFFSAWTGAARNAWCRGKWRSARFMPRWASRFTLEVISVRVERLNEISKEDAKAEGMYCGFIGGSYDFPIGPYDAYTANYRKAWDEINAKRGYPWESNCWVWVIEFKRIEQP